MNLTDTFWLVLKEKKLYLSIYREEEPFKLGYGKQDSKKNQSKHKLDKL